MGIFIIKWSNRIKRVRLIGKIGWIVFVFYSLIETTFAQSEKELIRTFSYDTGYSSSAYSNRAITHFGLELTQASSLLFDGVSSLGIRSTLFNAYQTSLDLFPLSNLQFKSPLNQNNKVHYNYYLQDSLQFGDN